MKINPKYSRIYRFIPLGQQGHYNSSKYITGTSFCHTSISGIIEIHSTSGSSYQGMVAFYNNNDIQLLSLFLCSNDSFKITIMVTKKAVKFLRMRCNNRTLG